MSYIESKSITDATADSSVLTTETWTQITVIVDGLANGSTEIRLGGSSAFLLTPGDSVSFMAEPGTDVKAVTTSSAAVRVDFIITELKYIEDALGCIEALGALLSQFGQPGALLPAIQPPDAPLGASESGESSTPKRRLFLDR